MNYNCNIINNEIIKNRSGERRVFLVLIITLMICLLEFIGGIIAGSFALIADAGHMLTDSASLFICYFAALIARRDADSKKTYGYFRVEILAALINGTLLIMLSLFVFYNGIKRFFVPFEINGNIMFLVSVVGLIANFIGIILLKGHFHNLNIKGALLHIIGDTLSSVGIVLGSILIIFFNLNVVDALLSILIGAIIFYNALRLVKDAIDVLMEAAPSHIDIDSIINEIKSNVGNVRDVHDIHIWSISSGIYILSLHIVSDASSIGETDRIINDISRLIKGKYGIEHLTIQVESTKFERC